MDFDPKNSIFDVDCYSFHQRKSIKSSQLFQLIGLKSFRLDAEWSVTCFEHIIALLIDHVLFQLSFSSETGEFSYASKLVYHLPQNSANSKSH